MMPLDVLRKPSAQRRLVLGITLGMLCLALFSGLALAAPAAQEATPEPQAEPDCAKCHLNIADLWTTSPHAHAFDDPTFQDYWQGHGQPGECLSCHTTGYMASSGEFKEQGVGCVECHGTPAEGHPPAVVPVKADTEYCGSCHTTTLSEWRQTGHKVEEVGCSDCHDPHDQQPLYEVADDLCIGCHKDDMGDYLEDLHVQKDIGCVDCHALVIPPETPPDDGIVPTGHTFTITAGTCVACHTDALHAGFALPGYENGAHTASEPDPVDGPAPTESAQDVQSSLSPEQQIQTLETALVSRQLTSLLQGSIVGLVLGGSAAWMVAHNVRRSQSEEEPDEDA